MKNKIVKTKLTESEMKLYLSGDQTYKAGGTLKGYQVNSVRGGNCPSGTMGSPIFVFIADFVRASRSIDLFLQSCVAV